MMVLSVLASCLPIGEGIDQLMATYACNDWKPETNHHRPLASRCRRSRRRSHRDMLEVQNAGNNPHAFPAREFATAELFTAHRMAERREAISLPCFFPPFGQIDFCLNFIVVCTTHADRKRWNRSL